MFSSYVHPGSASTTVVHNRKSIPREYTKGFSYGPPQYVGLASVLNAGRRLMECCPLPRVRHHPSLVIQGQDEESFAMKCLIINKRPHVGNRVSVNQRGC